ncbi:MAG TPA: gephyrin-like molybdotransferase Glp [Solirubrobacteraceae bacterium]|nr:gephyrin-like molybdotransferase Glp [Solirubrobacteraceae bacterium]
MAAPSSDPARASIPLIAVDQAIAQVLGAAPALPDEHVAIDDALHRVLAADVLAAGDVPPFPCSAMDGYALHAGPGGRRLALVGESRAGTPSDRVLADGEAIRVSTGAAIPAGATAVIPQEDVDAEGDPSAPAIVTRRQSATGAHVRGAGEDMRQGTVVLSAGRRLGPIELGAAVAAGAGSLAVARRPRVAVLCTGDELRAPGEPLGPGEIHNSNAPMLTGLAAEAGALTSPAGRLSDDRDATIEGIGAAIERSDVVLMSGGVSVGPHDHVRPALAALGVREVFWSVALQPGKPTWFGVARDGTLVFGLPGNPVSAVVTYALFAAPALAAMQGEPPPAPPRPTALLGVDRPRNPRREQALRVSLRDEPGGVTAVPTGAQGSHILSSLLDADALATIPIGEGVVAAGDEVALRAFPGRC